MDKNINSIKLISISDMAKELGLVDKTTLKPQTHTIRFWEKNFSQIKPTLLTGKRRFYGKNDIELLKLIKYLLKDEGLTIKGVKKILKNKTNKLDDLKTSRIKAEYLKLNLKRKTISLLTKIKNLKI